MCVELACETEKRGMLLLLSVDFDEVEDGVESFIVRHE